MPLLSVLKAAFRFNKIHGDREYYKPPNDISMRKDLLNKKILEHYETEDEDINNE